MKRKLDSNDIPAPVDGLDSSSSRKKDIAFSDLGLNPLLLQAITKQNFKNPTLVQIEAIPLALAGRDLLVRAKTGSGKTAAYLLPILHSILKSKQNSSTQHVSSLILVPTRELAQQVFEAVESFSSFCTKDIRAVNLTEKVSQDVQRSILSDVPDIIVATPARAALNLNTEALSFDNLTHLVIDEADLVLSYGYDDDLKNISKSLPKNCQNFLVSATLTEEVDTLKGLFCRDPVILQLEEPEENGEGVTQYVVNCAEDEKFLLIYVIFKLRLIKGKCIVFVADIDRCYRLKLYLEQFGIRSCILNSELPVNSRIHVVEEFNKNVYDIIIASDEHEVLGDEEDSKPEPVTEGRTARAGKTGMAISFVIPSHEYKKHKPTSIESAEHDEKVLSKIKRQQAKAGKEIKPYNFDMKQIDAFRYRMGDALRAVTKIGIREARSREVREELIRSEKLKRHFEENPDDLKHLRHDGELRPARVQSHLKHVPDYLLPKDGKKGITNGDVGFIRILLWRQNNILQVPGSADIENSSFLVVILLDTTYLCSDTMSGNRTNAAKAKVVPNDTLKAGLSSSAEPITVIPNLPPSNGEQTAQNGNGNVDFTVKAGLARMLKGGVIMDVVNAEQARIAEEAGAVAVMALERVPADIRAEGGVARMSDPKMIKEIMASVTIPVMAKARIGHFVECQILQAIGVDYIDESEVLTPADHAHHVEKHAFKVPFVCGCRNLGEALRRISEGAAMIRTKGEAGTGDVVEAVRHMRTVNAEIAHASRMSDTELRVLAKDIQAPFELLKETAKLGRLPVVNFAAGGIATPADAALMMQLGCDGVFVGSGIFKSGDAAKRAKAIVQAVTHYNDPKILAEVSEDLGEAMVGINTGAMEPKEKMQGRGW
ncbi:hypothetical protein B7463_g5729, partial [Scytalidium lignicola]